MNDDRFIIASELDIDTGVLEFISDHFKDEYKIFIEPIWGHIYIKEDENVFDFSFMSNTKTPEEFIENEVFMYIMKRYFKNE